VPRWFEHRNGASLADYVFPFLLFIGAQLGRRGWR
jgi:hypothetical protein